MSSEQVNIDIDKISTWLTKEIGILHPLCSECCIYRVPDRLRRLNEELYTPRVVSIGPIHHGKEKLMAMEEHKKRFLKVFLQMSTVEAKDCIRLVLENETRLRNCYAEAIALSGEEFAKIILVDAAFIIMVLLRCSFNLSILASDDRMFKKPKMMRDIKFDMLLLENQVPFFILEELFKLSNVKEYIEECFDLSHLQKYQKGITLIWLCNYFFESYFCSYVNKFNLQKNYPSEIGHLLDLVRNCYTLSDSVPQQSEKEKVKYQNGPSIRELHQAGVRFEPGSKENIFDIKFSNGVLQIPPFKIKEDADMLFRNLQAYEQCHFDDILFGDYIAIMDLFVKTPKDVELLIQSGVIKDWECDPDEAAPFFRKLGKGNIYSGRNNFRYAALVQDLNAYYAAPWHKWKATWKQKYFKTPWAIFSVIAAVFLLILTIIQAVCSILQVK